MSAIEYSNLLFEISERLDELNALRRLLFMCRANLASGSEGNIQDALSLFGELEDQNILGADRLEVIKELLKSFKEWSLFGKVRKFESKRKKYNELLEQIICALDELGGVERLITICKGKISEDSEGHIQDVRSLFKELENQSNLGYDRLDILKGILNEMEKSDLVKEVEEFEERRSQEDELQRKEDEFERRKAQAAAVVSTVGNKLIGVLNIKTVFRVVAGGINVVSTLEVLSRWSTFDQLVTAVNSCVLPAGTSLVQLTDGCVCLTVRAETLSALVTLWKLYQDGTLETRLYDFFVTDEVRERAGGEEVEVDVTIEEQEYEKACRELSDEAQEAASSDAGERIRRNSDSAVPYFRPKEVLSLLKLKHADAELKFLKERIAAIEREISTQMSPRNAHEATEMDERTDEPETSVLSKAKLMDPEKLAFVEKYLEEVQDTRSLTTEASDSGLVTQAAASELGTEETSEAHKLQLKDLSQEVTRELIRRLEGDRAAMEKFCRFFGLKMQDLYSFIDDIKQLFPDTTVDMLKECFEALQLYDLTEILEKVRPRSLRPALSPEEIEKLRGEDDRPTRYHSNVAVLIVKDTDKENEVERENEEKIKAFFTNLSKRNEVTVMSCPEENQEALTKIEERRQEEEDLMRKEFHIRERLKVFSQLRKHVKKKPRVLDVQWIEQEERKLRQELQDTVDMVAKLGEQIERDVEIKPEELKREKQKAVSTAMEKWIHNRGLHRHEKFSCVVVFVICDGMLFRDNIEACVVETLALIPGHAKLVVSPYGRKMIGRVPETLPVMYRTDERHTSIARQSHLADERPTSIFSRMIEILNKRWQTLDLISMMQELQRACNIRASYRREYPNIFIQDNLSTRLRFQKKEEKSSLKETSDSATGT